MIAAAAQRLRSSSMHALRAYDKSEHRLLVVGGSGFVGSNILQRAVQKGIGVRSLNRSGKPQWQDVPWIDQVDWRSGSVFNEEDLAEAVEGVTGVSTCQILKVEAVCTCTDEYLIIIKLGLFVSISPCL